MSVRCRPATRLECCGGARGTRVRLGRGAGGGHGGVSCACSKVNRADCEIDATGRALDPVLSLAAVQCQLATIAERPRGAGMTARDFVDKVQTLNGLRAFVPPPIRMIVNRRRIDRGPSTVTETKAPSLVNRQAIPRPGRKRHFPTTIWPTGHWVRDAGPAGAVKDVDMTRVNTLLELPSTSLRRGGDAGLLAANRSEAIVACTGDRRRVQGLRGTLEPAACAPFLAGACESPGQHSTTQCSAGRPVLRTRVPSANGCAQPLGCRPTLCPLASPSGSPATPSLVRRAQGCCASRNHWGAVRHLALREARVRLVERG